MQDFSSFCRYHKERYICQLKVDSDKLTQLKPNYQDALKWAYGRTRKYM